MRYRIMPSQAATVCDLLRVPPGELADIFTREVGRRHLALARQARLGRIELGGWELERLAHYLMLIGELEAEDGRRDEAEIREAVELQGGESVGVAQRRRIPEAASHLLKRNRADSDESKGSP